MKFPSLVKQNGTPIRWPPHAMEALSVILLLLGMGVVGKSRPVGVECEPGFYLDPDLNCQNCPPWTFSSTRNQADHCANCTTNCFDGTNAEVLHPCNATHDMICQCKSGFYALTSRSQCRIHRDCKNCLKHRGTPSSNAVCHYPCPTTVSAESVTGSTGAFMNDISIRSSEGPNSSLLDMTTASSNQTASNYLLQIGLPLLIITILGLIVFCLVYHRKKICECLNLKRFCRQPLYEIVSLHGGDQELPVYRPPPPPLPPHRNASLGAGSNHELDGSDQRPTSHGTADESLLEPDDTSLPDSSQNEALAEVPNSQNLPLVPDVAAEASPEEVGALLHDSQRIGSLSLPPSAYSGVPLSEDAYSHAHLLFESLDVMENSPTGHDSDDLSTTSNSLDLRSSQMTSGSEDLQDDRRMSVRPCAQVRPLVRPRPDLGPQVNHQQYPQVNHQQHAQVNHLQPNHQPDVPNPVLDVESAYSIEYLNGEN